MNSVSAAPVIIPVADGRILAWTVQVQDGRLVVEDTQQGVRSWDDPEGFTAYATTGRRVTLNGIPVHDHERIAALTREADITRA